MYVYICMNFVNAVNACESSSSAICVRVFWVLCNFEMTACVLNSFVCGVLFF